MSGNVASLLPAEADLLSVSGRGNPGPTSWEHFADPRAAACALRSDEPAFCIDLAELRRSARRFAAFPGRVLYAVKCNPHPLVLQALFDAGVSDFDVASLDESRLVDSVLGRLAGQFFNNPAKTRSAVREASAVHGVAAFTADCVDEVDKVMANAAGGRPLVAVRLAVPSRNARYPLSGKFGAERGEAVEVLRRVASSGARTGITFHVGSQCLDPGAFADAVAFSADVAEEAGTRIDVIDVGGGFPAPYPGDGAPDLARYFDAIGEAKAAAVPFRGAELLCEPGRGLVATAGTSIVRVVLRRGRRLHLNDGVFGTLQELCHPDERRPATVVREVGEAAGGTGEFRAYGPTCDSADALGGPLTLPEDVREGDWIAIGMMGAYSLSMRTRFNGFHVDRVVTVGEPASAAGYVGLEEAA